MLQEALILSFCSSIYMNWKKMLVEQFQDVCLVHGHPWCVNRIIFALYVSPYCCKPSIQFLFKRIYGLEEYVDWRISRWLFSARLSSICKWDDFSYFWVSLLPKAFHQYFDQENIWFEEYVGWRIPRWLFSAWPSLVCDWDDICYFWIAILLEASLKFLLKRIYGLEVDDGWRIPKWLFSTWPSLMSEWGDFSYFWVSILQEAFHQVSV